MGSSLFTSLAYLHDEDRVPVYDSTDRVPAYDDDACCIFHRSSMRGSKVNQQNNMNRNTVIRSKS